MGKSVNGVGAAVKMTPSFRQGLLEEPSPQLDRDRLVEWITEKSSLSSPKRCLSFVLSHDVDGKDPRVITPAANLPKKITESDRKQTIERIVVEFAEASRTVAWTSSRSQRFMVSAHETEETEAAAFVYTFLVTPPADVGSNFQQPDDSPNHAAVLGQMQRLLDTSLRQGFSNMQAMMDRLFEERREFMRHNESLLQQRMDAAERMEKLLDAKSLRDVTEHKTRMQLELEYQVYQFVIQQGGALATKYLASKVGGAADLDHPLVKFAKTLTPTQLVSFMATLSEEQRREFAPIVPALLSGMSAEQKAELSALLTSTNPVEPNGDGT